MDRGNGIGWVAPVPLSAGTMWTDSIFQTATVIASEAKQSISQRKESMDCFVASLLATTRGYGPSTDVA
jgi:hypothetical protein